MVVGKIALTVKLQHLHLNRFFGIELMLHQKFFNLHLQQFTVQTPQTESQVGFIKPVQVSTTTTNIETEHNTTDATVVSDSNVAAESPPTNSDVAVADAEVEYCSKFVEETVAKSDDSVEQRNEECVEEMVEESLTEKLVSVKEDEEKSEEEWEWEGIERSEVEKELSRANPLHIFFFHFFYSFFGLD
jgi:hypothetical protein